MLLKTKANYLYAPVTIVVVAIVTICLVIFKQPWSYYLIGALTALLNHGIMIKTSFRIKRYAELDPKGQTLSAKKLMLLSYLIRSLLVLGVFIALAFKADFNADYKLAAIRLVVALAGFVTVKAIFVIFLIAFRDDKEIENAIKANKVKEEAKLAEEKEKENFSIPQSNLSDNENLKKEDEE